MDNSPVRLCSPSGPPWNSLVDRKEVGVLRNKDLEELEITDWLFEALSAPFHKFGDVSTPSKRSTSIGAFAPLALRTALAALRCHPLGGLLRPPSPAARSRRKSGYVTAFAEATT